MHCSRKKQVNLQCRVLLAAFCLTACKVPWCHWKLAHFGFWEDSSTSVRWGFQEDHYQIEITLLKTDFYTGPSSLWRVAHLNAMGSTCALDSLLPLVLCRVSHWFLWTMTQYYSTSSTWAIFWFWVWKTGVSPKSTCPEGLKLWIMAQRQPWA